jgi:hypothetical protein
MAGNHIRRILYVQCILHGKKKDKMGQRRRGLAILLPLESESAIGKWRFPMSWRCLCGELVTTYYQPNITCWEKVLSLHFVFLYVVWPMKILAISYSTALSQWMFGEHVEKSFKKVAVLVKTLYRLLKKSLEVYSGGIWIFCSFGTKDLVLEKFHCACRGGVFNAQSGLIQEATISIEEFRNAQVKD